MKKTRHAGVFQRCPATCTADPCRTHRYSYTVEVTSPSGARDQRTKSGFATVTEAKAARDEIVKQSKAGELTSNPKLTVQEWYETWLDTERSNASIKPASISFYEQMFRHILPRIGHRRLSELRTAHVTQMHTSIREAAQAARDEQEAWNLANPKAKPRRKRFVSPSTHRSINRALSACLTDAIRAGEMTKNVTEHAEMPRAPRKMVTIPWDVDEIGRFLDEIEGEPLAPLYECAIFTGLRRGELLGLTWANIDFERGLLVVVGNRVLVNGRPIDGSVKTAAGDHRIVPLAENVVELLRRVKKRQAGQRLAAGPAWGDSEGYVFTDHLGKRWLPDHVSKKFVKLVRKLGLPHIPFHDQRDLKTSLHIANGDDLVTVSKLLGHSTLSTTADRYGHLFTKASQQAATGAAALVPRRARG